MVAFTRFHCFPEHLAEKVHNLGADALTIALTNTEPSASGDSTLADVAGVIDHTNLSSRVVTVSSSSQTGGTYSLDLSDLTLTANGTVPDWRYALLYNDTAANDEVIGYWDRGSTVSMVIAQTMRLSFEPITIA